MVVALGEGETTEELKKALKDHTQELMAAKPEDRVTTIGLAVRYCRWQKAFQKGTAKLEVRVECSEDCKAACKVWAALRKIIVSKKGGELRQGRAPANALQRSCTTQMRNMGMLQERAVEMED
eukprot:TRINITY_DN20344_c0_g2_i1.p3 TRINITY_DN20344_c0_g2~~TRINITY_DN20344_c0_g2_i1.p3  ORF type:complete len:123 (-),score=36.28 TRINITY_DN20344_c0_g2_i1:570-938(-)